MRYALIFFLLFSAFCKEPTNYWNPKSSFPLLQDNGSVSQNAMDNFSLQNVPADAEVLFINFFAPDCKPCIIEVPDIKKIYASVKDNPKIHFIAIGSTLTSLSDQEIKDLAQIAPEVHKFVKSYKIPYPAHLGLTGDLKNFGLTGFPESFILYKNEKKQWYVKRRFVGMITEKDVMPFLHG